MTVFRAIHKSGWSWPTRLAPLLHEIMFCLGLSYVKEVPYLGTIYMFSQWRQNIKSLYFKVITLSCLLPLTFQFTMSLWSCPKYYTSLLLTDLDIIYSSSDIANHQQFIFSQQLMCNLLLHCLPSTSGNSQIENVDGRGFGLSVCKLRL